MGGHLAVVTSEEQNRFLTGAGVETGSPVGLAWATDEQVEGQWVWVDGSPLRYSNWDTVGKQPNNKRGVEDITWSYGPKPRGSGVTSRTTPSTRHSVLLVLSASGIEPDSGGHGASWLRRRTDPDWDVNADTTCRHLSTNSTHPEGRMATTLAPTIARHGPLLRDQPRDAPPVPRDAGGRRAPAQVLRRERDARVTRDTARDRRGSARPPDPGGLPGIGHRVHGLWRRPPGHCRSGPGTPRTRRTPPITSRVTGRTKKNQPPDLAIEVVVSHPAKKALRAGAFLKIPELWVLDIPRHRLTFYHLAVAGQTEGDVPARSPGAGRSPS